MNRTYKVIWSKVRRCYVVVSELAKGQHKSSSKSEHISSNVHRGGDLGKAAAAAVVASLLIFGGLVYSPVMADSVTDANGNTITNTDTKTDINANITGKSNNVTDSSNAEIVGDKNTVTNEVKDEKGNVVTKVRSDDARIVGSDNTISGSRNQQVIGDHNTIIGRDKGTVTDYGHPEGRDLSVADITIGRENTIHSGDTYRNEWDSLTVIGNHNIADSKLVDSAGGPASGIVVGSNQNIDGIEESIVIGSLSPAEQNEKTDNPNHHDKYTVGRNSIILGNHASNTMGESIVVGNRSQGNGRFQTIMGHRSVIQGYADQSEANYIAENYGALSSIYGAFNTIESARPVFEDSSNYDPYFKAVDGFGNSINGTLNKTSSARGTMIMGAANTVTHSQPDIIKANVFGTDDSMDDVWLQDVTSAVQYYNLGDDNNLMNLSYDDAIAAMKAYAANASGAVSVLGNGNAADYAIRSQILGTANTLTGNQNKISANNTINGYGNTGTNITHSAVVGSNNTLSNGEDNVVIGDYHNMDGGKHNVVLGSMKSKEQTSQKEYKSPVWQNVKYNVTEQVPVKDHTKDIENAVMVGYNTDVTENGGVALGSDSIASTEAGKIGYDAKGKTHAKSDTDYATWVSTDAAVSVGRAEEKDEKTGEVTSKAITRQITNLAAGTQDTDAVNVAQLKASEANINTTINNVDKKVAVIFDDKGSLMSTDATIDHEHEIGYNITNVSKGIALGHNAYVYNQGGSKANAMLFGSPTYTSGIAIGENSYVLEDSIDLGNKIYKGAMGDVSDLSKYNAQKSSGTGRLLIGNNSYSSGTLSTLIGNHSIMTTNYLNGGNSLNAMQNAGAVSIGALNSIESYSSKNGMSGVANNIIGLANKTTNANGALILGAGNEIKNSITSISVSGSASKDVATASQDIRDRMANGYAGGATLLIGGGNKADYTQKTQIIGVANTVQGSQDKPSIYNMVDGYSTSLNNSSHVYTIGYRNDFNNENNSVVIGDYHQLTNGKNNVVIGSYDGSYQPAEWDKPESTTYLTNDALEDAVMIGHNANAKVDGGVALGAGSVASVDNASVDKNAIGYDPATKKPSTVDSSTWKSTAAAVSVGRAEEKDKAAITRQITNLAAGFNDTDAVNVAQLKAVMNLPVHIYNGGKFASNVYTGGTQIATDMTISNLQFDFGDGLKAQEVGNEGDKRVLVTLDKDALKDDPDFKGPKGDKGDKGDTGATGEQGPQGEKGDKGDAGVQGPKGDKGDTGAQGPKGDTGAQGPKGETGAQGPKGDTGAPGKDGMDGKDGGVGTVVGDEMNITVANTETDPAKPANYKVSLNKEITVDKVTAGNTTISSDGLIITGGPSVTQSGINAGDKKITNVADGIISKDSKDAINGSQLYNETRVAKDGNFVKQANTAGENLSALDNQVTANTESIYHINNRVSDLDNRVNKVGAGAAALAALHPLDFDPDDKWDFAVGYGNYRNANSVAFGAFYRPNEDTMFSLGTNFGNGENMFNAGLSFKIGQGGSGITTSKTAMAKTISSLKDTVHKQDQKIEGLENVVDTQDKKIAELEALVKEQGEMIRQYVGKK